MAITKEAQAILDAHQEDFAKAKKQKVEEAERWEKEILSLESRITNEAVEIDLGNGASIAIRTCLLAREVERLDFLEKSQLAEEDSKKREAMACEMIEIITANPLITKEWLMDNRDKYSPADVLAILLGFLEVRLQERMEHVRRLQSAALFRSK